MGKNKGCGKAIGSNVDGPRKNHFYALRSRGEQGSSPDVVTGLVHVFSFNVNTLLDICANLSFLTPLVSRKFDILPDILNEYFMVTIPVGHSVVAEWIYRNCPILLPNRATHFELVELMDDFNIILGMDWLHGCFSSIDCTTRVVIFNFPNELVL